MQKFLAPIPLSLYIHIPWCVRKCPYCDFNSHEAKHDIPEQEYIHALLADLDENLAKIANRKIVSIFFGGGTPSLFSPDAIHRILNGIKQYATYEETSEITLEANPGTIDEARFKGFREAGINRLSIGIQSLQNEKLHALGRIHNREYALRAIEAACKAGFTNYNVDLMHGLPNQSLEDALQDLSDALTFQPPHLSWYQLTIEPNTLFHHKPPALPQDDALWQIQERGNEKILAHGFSHYEVSAYAQPNHECLHNRNYWEFGDYLGIGAGAHSKITDITTQQVTRHWQVKHPRHYLDATQNKTADHTVVTEKDLRFEFMMNALRLTNGVPSFLFSERTGLPLTTLEPQLSFAREKQLLIADENRLCATPQGQRFLNDVISLFL